MSDSDSDDDEPLRGGGRGNFGEDGLEVTKGKHLRILRQVVNVLPALLRQY